MQTAKPISTKFCTDLHTNSEKVFNTPPTLPPDAGYPQTPKPKQITGEKTLLYKKCIKIFPGSAGPRLAKIDINVSFIIHICVKLHSSHSTHLLDDGNTINRFLVTKEINSNTEAA